MNELREANFEECVVESDNVVDDALDLEEGFTNDLLERQIDVDGTTIFGEESGRIPPRTHIDWTPPPVKTKLGEPEFETVENPGQWSDSPLSQSFQKEAVFTKDMLFPQDSCHYHNTLVVQDKSMGGSFITMIGMM